jgi:hypothetical protein
VTTPRPQIFLRARRLAPRGEGRTHIGSLFLGVACKRRRERDVTIRSLGSELTAIRLLAGPDGVFGRDSACNSAEIAWRPPVTRCLERQRQWALQPPRCHFKTASGWKNQQHLPPAGEPRLARIQNRRSAPRDRPRHPSDHQSLPLIVTAAGVFHSIRLIRSSPDGVLAPHRRARSRCA